MHCVRKVSDDIYWIGANDKRLQLFENIHPLTDGVSYNSYVLLDEKTVLLDTADWSVGRQFIENLEFVLAGRPLDYMIINHMEPDHCASIEEILLRYPDVKVIATAKAFQMMEQFGFGGLKETITVKEGDTMSFGKHEFTFVGAPMVHWPEAWFPLIQQQERCSAPMPLALLSPWTGNSLPMKWTLTETGLTKPEDITQTSSENTALR